MIQVDVRSDIRGAQLFLKALAGKEGTARATSRALNRTAITVRAEAARLLHQKRALNIGVIKKSMKITNATTSRLVATVTVSGKAISIRNFAALRFDSVNGQRVGVKGVTIKIERAGRRRIAVRHGNKAFTSMHIGRNGAEGLPVVVRTKVMRMRKSGKERGRLDAKLEAWPAVPGLPRVFVQDAIIAALKVVVAREFPKRFAAEMNYEVNVAKQKAGGVARAA